MQKIRSLPFSTFLITPFALCHPFFLSTAILNDGDPSGSINQPAYKRPSRHLYGSLPDAKTAAQLCFARRGESFFKKKKDFTRCSTSHKWQSLIESHVEPSHSAPPRCTHCSREQLLRAYTHWPHLWQTAHSHSHSWWGWGGGTVFFFSAIMRPWQQLNPGITMTSQKPV